ncbi:MAG: hypothetical protein Q8S13_08645 [Dehalococcoidia bacterium]|nr:hypothetical protein [Dehalococcoidia bacterium]
MKIALDAMGGDIAPEPQIAGAVRAARELPVEIILVGPKDELERQLAAVHKRPANLSIHHASEVIGMSEPPVSSVRKKRDSTINVGHTLMKQHKVDAFVSAGNTGAMAAAGTLICGLLPGVERPGIAIVLSVLGFYLLGEALREALDPKLRR